MPRKQRRPISSGDEIPTSKFEEAEFDHLDAYLDDDFNYQIFLRRRNSMPEAFPEDNKSALKFFQTFYRSLSFLKSNLDKPLTVENEAGIRMFGTELRTALLDYANYLKSPGLRDSRALKHLQSVEQASKKRLREHVDALHHLYAREDANEEEIDEKRNEYDPASRGLTRQLAMLLIDELFPNLKEASNTAKAEFLSLLTGFDADGLRQKWSDYKLGNKKNLKTDMETVKGWKRKLQIKENAK